MAGEDVGTAARRPCARAFAKGSRVANEPDTAADETLADRDECGETLEQVEP